MGQHDDGARDVVGGGQPPRRVTSEGVALELGVAGNLLRGRRGRHAGADGVGGDAVGRQLDRQLADNRFIAGDEYTIADMALWPWYGNGIMNGASYDDPRRFLQTHEYKNLARWTKEIGERPAVKRGRMVNRTSGPPEEQLHERHDASDFKTKTQDKIAARG